MQKSEQKAFEEKLAQLQSLDGPKSPFANRLAFSMVDLLLLLLCYKPKQARNQAPLGCDL